MDDPKQKRSRELQRDRLFENELDDLLEVLGITFSGEFNLILHNDNINEKLYVVLVLSDVCSLSYEKSMIKMTEAHEKGRSILINSNNIDVLHYMRLELVEKYGLMATLEKAD
jgi:ATP-dependent Clp protease adapter protein ClpS